MTLQARIAIRQANAIQRELEKWGHPEFATLDLRLAHILFYAAERGKTIKALTDGEWLNYRNRLLLLLWEWTMDTLTITEQIDIRGLSRSLARWQDKKVLDNQFDSLVIARARS